MRPKRNVPSHNVSLSQQQQMRSSQMRRVEETQYAGGPSGTHRARPTFDSTGGSSRALSKGIPRRDLAPTLVDSLIRRPGATPSGSRSAGRTDSLSLPIADQRPVFKKSVTTKFSPPLTSSPIVRSRVYNSEATRNRKISLYGIPPDRTRNLHKSSARNISGRSQGLLNQTQCKCRSPKKTLSKKRRLIDISIKDNVLSGEEMCLMAQLQNTLSMAVLEEEESVVNVPEMHKYVTSNIQPQNEIYSVTSYSTGTLPLAIQESKSNHTDENDSVERVNEDTASVEDPSLVIPSPLQTATPAQSTEKVQITPDDSPGGWERVLLSLQVQMSPLSSPSASSTAVENKQHVSHSYSCNTNRSFQTTSEILVLPIFARQRLSQRNWVANKPCDTGLRQGPIGNALMKEILECKNYEIDIDNSTNVNQPTIFEIQRNLVTEGKDNSLDTSTVGLADREQTSSVCKIDFSVTRAMHENDSISKQAFDQQPEINVSNVDSLIKLEKDLTFPISSHKEDRNVSSENIVTELQLNQNDIVKMAYEIIDIVSKIHESRNTRSQTFENTDLNASRRGRSADLILKYSEDNVPSTCTTRSLKNFDTKTGISVSETISESLKLLEDCKTKRSSEEISHNCLSSKVDTYESYDVSGNAFKLPKALPILLYQNKQVQKILKHFVSKLEENDEKSRDHGISQSAGILEVRISSTEGEIREGEGDDYDLNEESLREIEEQSYKEFVDLKEYQELGVQISNHTEKVDFSVNVCLSDNNANEALQDKSVAYDESTASEADTEKSLGVDSEAGAEDGDDEATASASESVEEQENTNIDTPNDPTENTVCMCREKENICPRHPAQNEEAIQDGTCQCERFQELCTEFQVPIASTSQAESNKEIHVPEEADQGMDNVTHSTHNGGSLTSNKSKSGSWIPWVRESGSGPHIPDFNPSADPNIMDNVSSVTIPPHVTQNTMNLLENRDQDLSIWGSNVNIPPWIPNGVRDDEVPDTITEFHWMPDGLRGFSSTIIYPEIPDDLEPYPSEERPLLCKPKSTPDSSASGLAMRTSPRKLSDSTKVAINPDAPKEVPHGAISASVNVAVEGTFFDVLTNTMEKSIMPLKTAIDDLKAKIDRLETTHIASMRPDILVGVTSVPTCSARSGQSNGGEEQGTTCVPPFGLYILHQRSSLAGNAVPLSTTKGSAIEGAAQKIYVPGKSIPCVRCIDKLQTLSPSKTDNPPNHVENSEPIRPPTPFSATTEADGGGGRGGGGNVPESSSVPENLETVSESQLPPSDGQISDRCICKSLEKLHSAGNVDQPRRCPKCNKCSPSQIFKNTPEACDTCCKQSVDRQEESLQSGTVVNIGNQKTSEHKVCVTCKTCISNVTSFESNIPGVPRPPCVNIPCFQCCNGPVLRKLPLDYPWHRLKNCPGCAHCPYPPPCPPRPPPKPKLSPIAQMYLDMSRAKYDWSDMSEGEKKHQCKKSPVVADYEPENKPEAYKTSENYADQHVDPEDIENEESYLQQDSSQKDGKEEETDEDFMKSLEEEVTTEAVKQDTDTTKGVEDIPNFQAKKFPCVCPRDYCIPPENLQCEENEPTRITDEELEFRKINHPCACPREFCVPPEIPQHEHVEEPRLEENLPTEENMDSGNIQNSSENLAPDPENQPT